MESMASKPLVYEVVKSGEPKPLFYERNGIIKFSTCGECSKRKTYFRLCSAVKGNVTANNK